MNLMKVFKPNKQSADAGSPPLRPQLIVFILIMLVLAFFAYTSAPYWQTVCVLFAINLIMVIGYRVVTMMGGWSFAHVALMGLGGYTTALMVTGPSPWPFWIAFLASGFASGLFAAIVSYPVLRTRTFYFVLSTFAAGEAITQSLIQFREFTGGTNGIASIPRPSSIGPLEFETTLGFFNLVLFVTCAIGVIALVLDNSRTGRTIKAVALNEDLSRSLGVDTWLMRSSAFVIGSVFAGLAGSLFAQFNAIINPADFSSALMFKYVAACIVGGTSTFFGPMLGLLFLTGVEEVFRNALSWVPLLWGVAVLASVLFFRGGLEGVLASLLRNAWLRLTGKGE